jgi:hypothetical protein
MYNHYCLRPESENAVNPKKEQGGLPKLPSTQDQM